jgi:GNAT superfamily N-acetyltransferase
VETTTIRALGEPGDLGWVVKAHGEQYAAEFGWDVSFETLVARIVADYATDHDLHQEAAWIAEREGRRVGCIFCVRKDEETAQLRILLVTPDGRGQGLGRRLVDEVIGFARAAGYRRLVLWTNDPLAAARRIYLAAGFRLGDEEKHHSFGVDLIGQNYALDLVSCAGNPLRISADPAVRRQGAGPRLVPGVLGRASNAADVRLGRRDMWRIFGGGY